MTALYSTLQKVFGFSSFRDGQERVCDALLAGRSALAIFPTGGGKSLCYQLPALLLPGLTLVVSPLIALMKDQVDFLKSKGVPAARLDSSLDAAETAAILDGIAAGRLKLLYVAPERFLNERFLDRMARARISLLAIDEAHCISQWGHNFRPDYLKLAEYARHLRAERVLALTATATPRVGEDIAAAFAIARDDRVLTGFYRPNLTLEFVSVSRDTRDDVLLASSFDGPTIVYVTLQKTAERIARKLASQGLAARAYHAGMESDERAAIQDWFMAGDDRIVVATIAFGMGIDKSNIRAVVHYNLPKSLESYTQEIGRAGRDGKPSLCRMLACRDDLPTLANFVYGDTPTRTAVEGVVAALLDRGPAVEVSYRTLSDAHDMRELVVKTLVTYLELDGLAKQTTPIYAEYKWKYLTPRDRVLAQFDEARRRFLDAVFAAATEGRTWARLDLAEAAERLGEPRERLVRALDYLAEKGHLELQATGLRQRLVVLRRPDDRAALIGSLVERFETLEAREVARLQEVVDFVEGDGCHTTRLVGYFGERLERPCGHCTFCLTGKRVRLEPATPPAPFPSAAEIRALRAESPNALAEPRSVARFLCGLTSPALTRGKLSRHPLYGSLTEADFRDVLEWASRQGTAPRDHGG
ncbi:MAG TPA: ATP-dependent DNA helicase RecQ [Polyangia bacterium]|jgi:ATP-dependent DNA helicase RecQ|nr:ATP-dependent DNA helicase RecQ [Polyangia bacterium]